MGSNDPLAGRLQAFALVGVEDGPGDFFRSLQLQDWMNL